VSALYYKNKQLLLLYTYKLLIYLINYKIGCGVVYDLFETQGKTTQNQYITYNFIKIYCVFVDPN